MTSNTDFSMPLKDMKKCDSASCNFFFRKIFNDKQIGIYLCNYYWIFAEPDITFSFQKYESLNTLNIKRYGDFGCIDPQRIGEGKAKIQFVNSGFNFDDKINTAGVELIPNSILIFAGEQR